MQHESIWDIIDYVRQNQDDPAALKLEEAPALIGDSHSAVVFAAARKSAFPLRGVYFAIGPQPPYDEAISALHPDIARLAGKGRIFSAVSQSTHDVLTLLQHPQPFDFVLPERPELALDATAKLVPVGAVRDALRRHMHRDFKVLELLYRLCPGRMVHIISQPPLADSEIVAQTSPWPLKEGQSISSPALRLKTYHLYAALLNTWCAERDIGIISPPLAALDDQGFLGTAYRTNATHANTAYGQLVLAQMQDWL